MSNHEDDDTTKETDYHHYYDAEAVEQISLCHRNRSKELLHPILGLKPGHNFANYSGIADAMLYNVGLAGLLLLVGMLYWRIIHRYIKEGGSSIEHAIKNLFYGFLPQQWKENFRNERTTFNIYWFRLDKTFLKRSYGVEGMQYLCFQRYVIGLLLVINVPILSIVLPLNISFRKEKNHFTTSLKTTLIENLGTESNVLWIHLVIGWSFIPVSMYFMHLYCDMILADYFVKNEKSSLTLHVSRIPTNLRRRSRIHQWFKRKYPFAKVEKIYLAFETSHILTRYYRREMLRLTIQKCEKDTKLYRRPICRGYKDGPGEAIAEYHKQLKKNGMAIKEEIKKTLSKPLDTAFVTLGSHDHAKFIVECEKMSSISGNTFCSNGIKITFAPSSNFIEWVNMRPRRLLRLRRLVIVLLLIFLVLVFTTPQSWLIFASHATGIKKSGIVQDYKEIASILKIVTRMIINRIFTCSMKYMGYWKQLDINRNIIRLTTVYLLVVLLFLPTFEFLNIIDIFPFAKELYDESFELTNQKQHHWACVFKEEGVIVFVHFIIATAFLGTAIEYLRIPDIYYTLVDFFMSKSWPEVSARLHTRKVHFWFGEAYSLELLYFTITVGLSVPAPIITPLGLIFFLIKHCLSTYNLKFNRKQYIFTNIGFEFHVAAVSYVIGATVCLQWYNALVFNLLKADSTLGFASAFVAMGSTLFLLIGISSKWKYPIPIVRPVYQVSIKGVVKREDYIPYYLKEFKSHVHNSRRSHV